MLTHFREAQADLSTMPVASDLYRTNPSSHQANVTSMADLVAQRLLEAMPPASVIGSDDPSASLPPPELLVPDQASANTIQHQPVDVQAQTAMMAQMQTFMSMLVANQSGQASLTPSNSDTRSRRSGRGQGSQSRATGGRGSSSTTPRKYCHTHGACAHTGLQCNSPAEGHKAPATFANMMGGSTTGCYWIQA